MVATVTLILMTVVWSAGPSCTIEATAHIERSAFSFIVFGDLNGGGCDRNDRISELVGKMVLENSEFALCTGDFIDGYIQSDGSATCFGRDPVSLGIGTECPGETSNRNMAEILAPLKIRPPVAGLISSFYPVIGNHDDGWGSTWYPDPCGGGICDLLAPLTPDDFINHAHGDMCSVDPDQSQYSEDFYYSFSYQNSYFIVLRQNSDYYGMLSCNGGHVGYPDCGSYCADPALFDDPVRNNYCYAVQQFDWLRAELEYAEAHFTNIFAFAHAPLLGSGDGHLPTSGATQIRALLEAHGTKIYFNGHNHAYERTIRIRGDEPSSTGTSYITVGTAGALSDGVNGDWFTEASYRDWTYYGDQDYARKMTTYLKVTVDGEQISGEVYSLGLDQIVDTFFFTSGFETYLPRWRTLLPLGSIEDINHNGIMDVIDLIALNFQEEPSPPTLGGCNLFPSDSWWNTPVDTYDVHSLSDQYIASIGGDTALHPDFGTQWAGEDIGIPYNVVPAGQETFTVDFLYWDESDPGPYPIPPNPNIEGGSDRHILIVQQEECVLYELFDAYQDPQGDWHAGSGAVWHLDQNEMRPLGWTSADASGLPILPGLVRYEEIYETGEINHALRMTLNNIQRGYIRPASHTDGTGGMDPNLPPMGLRLRLKANVDISSYAEPLQIILRALKKYGVFIADTGSDCFLSGTHHDDWDDSLLHDLQGIKASDFEAVYTGEIIPY